MTKKERAMELFKEGYNCAQAVAGAFCDEMGIPFKTVVLLTSSFGGGMGKLREVCGTVTGMFFVLGALNGYSDPSAHAAKSALYKEVQQLAEEFKQENGSIICRELLSGVAVTGGSEPEKRDTESYKKRPCVELVGFSAQLLEKLLLSEKEM